MEWTRNYTLLFCCFLAVSPEQLSKVMMMVVHYLWATVCPSSATFTWHSHVFVIM